jgi:hypothetical protein
MTTIISINYWNLTPHSLKTAWEWINTNFDELNTNKIEIEWITNEILDTESFVISTPSDNLFKSIIKTNI